MQDGIRIKRAYESPADDDGYRVLVDRLWPRGVSKQNLKADLWLKDIAPSTDLRKWFNHQSEKWPEFRRKYSVELGKNTECLDLIRQRLKHGRVTLLYGAKDQEHNQAVVLRDLLRKNKD